MGDALEEVLDRHRRVWRELVWRYSFGFFWIGYLVGHLLGRVG